MMKRTTLFLLGFILCFHMQLFSNPTFENFEWSIGRINGKTINPDYFNSINFNYGEVTGSMYCNEFFAPYYNKSGNSIQIAPLRITKKVCPFHKEEAQIAGAVQHINNYRIENGILILLRDNEVKVECYPTGSECPWEYIPDPSSIEGATWYVHVLQGEEIPPCAKGIFSMDFGTKQIEIHAFCNEYTGDYNITMYNQITISDFYETTSKHCDGMMHYEYLFSSAIQAVNNYKIVDDRLLLFQDYNLLVELAQTPKPIPITGYSFSYDRSGNRISRQVIYLCDNYSHSFSKSGSGGKKLLNKNTDADYTEKPIERKANEYELKIYPNPTKGMLKVDVLSEIEIQNAFIEIYTVNGRTIYSTKDKKESYSIDLSNQAKGVYIMRIVLNNTPHEWKIIKE